MNYEKDSPDFALVPAKEPEERVLVPITQGAVYSPVQVTNITEKPVSYTHLDVYKRQAFLLPRLPAKFLRRGKSAAGRRKRKRGGAKRRSGKNG